MTSWICINTILSLNFTLTECPEQHPPPSQPRSICVPCPHLLWVHSPCGHGRLALLFPRPLQVDGRDLTVYCGDISGWFGCLVRKIHQPVSSALASLNRVLICQSVGFLHVNSSLFVSGKIAFVFLCLLIHPCRPLSLALCALLAQFRNGIQGVVKQRQTTPRGLHPSRLLGPQGVGRWHS